ncbi:hypothetical protein LEP1GSC016_1793 [Leptospira borgpetersenii serovar Hardjo-bovis str. Sponselee]|uniref:Uncharacterized protein n=2 Tax=Leptospira borgpetersenii TaxID=174 RepID=M6C6V5_LEPBO|nr:hypothetical protein LEP1GSC101_3344 [Leptospira borgpetersenii str. UI 09149]EMJ84508.1 hypothetical protein LEP1GSC016_1793 [Leptospira borgpetersenii serovar Hardjo-bovis str. Sponselee]EMN56847.1 hypothetical protein LEP1GSC090_1246 [Leptospira borgpetersenii serovar Javanica str. MK146]EPG58485.1 hypothetical protein LEP1GSC103_3006 [Leptospira borgpetersenii serovar Javanica str. UI 09931]
MHKPFVLHRTITVNKKKAKLPQIFKTFLKILKVVNLNT